MIRFALAAAAAACIAFVPLTPSAGTAPDIRALPMQFDHWTEGPADACGKDCRSWVSATGAITAETPRDFETFAKNRNLNGAIIALDSDGGSVHGAMGLGRIIRRLGMTTTVGKTVEVAATDRGKKRARLMPRAYCELMCAFVLLAGLERQVPAEARVLVHQIWLGDRRDDPTAANYSAEDLVLVQRDIGRLVQYTAEMGNATDMLEIALKIPPWEPMRLLSRDELRGMKIVTTDNAPEVSSGTATSMPALGNGDRSAINERSWIIADNSGRPALARKHPLTVEGDDIGSFDLMFGCGEPGRDYSLSYIEHRRSTGAKAPAAPTDVEVSLAGKTVPLKVVSSRPNGKPLEVESVATVRLPAELVKTFADARNRSMTVETTSDDTVTAIRVGNAGIARSFSQFIASCAGQSRTRSAAR